MSVGNLKRKRGEKHPYLAGNFAPIHQTRPLTPCSVIGKIPDELLGGQYVRNGGNPVSNEDLGRDAHWFDGDGMLSGVAFTKSPSTGSVEPAFVNQYILTDVYLSASTSPNTHRPILPSIATLVNPAASILKVTLQVFRTILLVILSFLAGSRQRIKKISVANTSILYHDGRALATCESGPPMRVLLPGLETVGWFNGNDVEGETIHEKAREQFGGDGLIGFMKEWTTGHPKVDPITKEMLLYHGTFVKPYVHYSVLPENHQFQSGQLAGPQQKRILNAPIPGVSGAKMMHDFGASRTHTVLLDLPLTLDPLNLARNVPVVSYDGRNPSRFGVFPRREPKNVRWYETKGCCIFHTANTWDEYDGDGKVSAISMLACRLTSASMVFGAANIEVPRSICGEVKEPEKPISFFGSYEYDEMVFRDGGYATLRSILDDTNSYEHAPLLEKRDPPNEKTPLLGRPLTEPPPITSIDNVEFPPVELETEQCRLYYYNFDLTPQPSATRNKITHQFALSILPFEFPSMNPNFSMQSARYIYGCSTSTLTSFGVALGKAAKIDVLLKIDAKTLIKRGEADPPRAFTGSVDNRTLPEVLASKDEDDPIKAFVMPGRWFAQEPRFVPRRDARGEDDGWLLFYAFDETQLDLDGEAPEEACSELWVMDARLMGRMDVGMDAVVARVKLPQRVPYGLHGTWFTEEELQRQRPVERLRSLENISGVVEGGPVWRGWMGVRGWLERRLG